MEPTQTSVDSGHARSDSGLGGDILPLTDNFLQFKQPVSWELKRKYAAVKISWM